MISATLFHIYSAPISGLFWRALHGAGHISIAAHNIRDFATDKHHKTDVRPMVGAGMVVKVEPIWKAVESLKVAHAILSRRIVLLSAKKSFRPGKMPDRCRHMSRSFLICRRYGESRGDVAEYMADEELSIGDFVLTGGELPALVIVGCGGASCRAFLVMDERRYRVSSRTGISRTPANITSRRCSTSGAFRKCCFPGIMLISIDGGRACFAGVMPRTPFVLCAVFNSRQIHTLCDRFLILPHLRFKIAASCFGFGAGGDRTRHHCERRRFLWRDAVRRRLFF